MSAQRPGIQITDLGELAGTIPMFVGYAPSEDDVVTVGLDGTGKTAFMGIVPDDSWGVLNAGLLARSMQHIINDSRTRHALVFGHGEMGQVRALALKEALVDLVEAGAFRVSGDLVQEVDHGFAGQWEQVIPPNPELAVEGGFAEPAADRNSLVERYGLIEDEQVTDTEAQGGQGYASLLPNNAGERADSAWAMLQDAGPGSSPIIRARIGALIAESVQTRDALLGHLLADGAPRQDNLEYVARTANDAHLAQVSALTAATVFFNGDAEPVRTRAYVDRGGELRLTELVNHALNVGIAPTKELRDSVQTSGLKTRANPAVEQTDPEPALRTTRPSIDGASGPGKRGQGPLMGPG